MVLVDFERLGIDLSPPKRIQKTFGWRTAAQCRERTLEKMARAAPPPAAPKNLSVCDRIAARKARTLATLGPKVSDAIRKRQTAGMSSSFHLHILCSSSWALPSHRISSHLHIRSHRRIPCHRCTLAVAPHVVTVPLCCRVLWYRRHTIVVNVFMSSLYPCRCRTHVVFTLLST